MGIKSTYTESTVSGVVVGLSKNLDFQTPMKSFMDCIKKIKIQFRFISLYVQGLLKKYPTFGVKNTSNYSGGLQP